MMTCGLTVTRSAGRFCINRFFFTFEHMIGSVSVTCLTCSRMSALRMSAPAMGSTHQYSYDELVRLWLWLRYSFRISTLNSK